MYFECNIDPKIPQFYHPEIYSRLVNTVALIHERTDKLNAALDSCSLKGCMTRGATFAGIAKTVFDYSTEKFDAMTAKELASVADMLYDGNDAEDRIEWPNAVVLFDTRFVTTRDWEALRHIGIGGSDSSVLMGCSPYQSEEGLWYEKLGYPEYVSEEEKQAVFDRGHFLEDTVIDTFCRLVGARRIPESRMFRHRDYPKAPGEFRRAGCSGTGIIRIRQQISTGFSPCLPGTWPFLKQRLLQEAKKGSGWAIRFPPIMSASAISICRC